MNRGWSKIVTHDAIVVAARAPPLLTVASRVAGRGRTARSARVATVRVDRGDVARRGSQVQAMVSLPTVQAGAVAPGYWQKPLGVQSPFVGGFGQSAGSGSGPAVPVYVHDFVHRFAPSTDAHRS